MGWERHAVAQVDTGASCAGARCDTGRHGCCIRSPTAGLAATAWQVLAAQVFVATADRRVSRPRVRQSAAQSRHQLLPARGARGACKWRVSAGSRCSDVAHSSPASASSVCDLEPRLGNQQRPSRHERPPTQTRPFGSVLALVAAVFGPAVGSAAPMSVAVNAADLQLHWQYVRRSRVHGDQRSCTCGMLAAQVLIATADRRVMSRPRVRQSAAP